MEDSGSPTPSNYSTGMVMLELAVVAVAATAAADVVGRTLVEVIEVSEKGIR